MTVAEWGAAQELREEVQQLRIDIRQVMSKQMTVTGNARVETTGNECCIRINTSSRAADYADAEKARITNLSHSDMPSTIVDISGTFQNPDDRYLAVISRVAASRIEAVGENMIDIRIQPAGE